jgi:hypothetical protein
VKSRTADASDNQRIHAGTAETASVTTASPGGSVSTEGGTSGGTSPLETIDATLPTELGRGVSADSINVGITYLDMDFLRDNGLVEQGWGDQELVWNTFVDALNARGGINGRIVEPFMRRYSPVNGVGVAADAQCLELIEDIGVFAVLGGFLGPAETSNECIVATNATPLIGGNQTEERLEAAQAAWLQFGGSRARRLEILVDLLDSEGMIEGKRIAIVGGLAAEEAAVLAKQLLDDKGANVVYEGVNTSEPGADIGSEDALWDVLGEQVRVNEANVLFAVGATTSAVRNNRRLDLGAELWIADSAELDNLGSSVEAADANGAITVTGLSGQESWDQESMVTECRDVFRAAHPDIEVPDPATAQPGEETWATSITLGCRGLKIFELVATAAGENLNNDTFAAAAASLGDMELPGSLYASSIAGKPDLNDAYRLSMWDATNVPTGEFVPLTEIADVTP